MAWTTEDRRRYAPAMQEVMRQGMLVRLAATIDAIDPPAPVGRPRVWPTLVMLQALWHVARDDRAWRRLPPGSPPHQTVWSRLKSWQRQAVLDRALRVLVACRRLAAGRKRWPTAAIIDTQSVKTGPQRGPRGYDANKKIKGRKRVLMIDTQGDPLGVQVVSGEVQDRDALHALAPDLDVHASLLLAWLDRGFAGDDQRPSSALRRHPRDRRHSWPQGLPGRAPTLEDRADLRLPATLSSAPGRRRDEQRDLAPHDHPGFGVHDRHAPRAHAPAVTISGRL